MLEAQAAFPITLTKAHGLWNKSMIHQVSSLSFAQCPQRSVISCQPLTGIRHTLVSQKEP